jgi:S1-C subfamily serine protease
MSERLRPDDYSFNLAETLDAIVEIRTQVPDDAFTAEVLGTERAGYGVLIRREGLILTVGYVVAEAETVWITLSDGRAVPGHVLAYEPETGFGLVQALARLDVPALKMGSAKDLREGDKLIVAGAGGVDNAIAATLSGRGEFAGYWEYVIDDALFTTPAHASWGGCAVIGSSGELLGIGSLLIQKTTADDSGMAVIGGEDEDDDDQNMCISIDLLTPILDDLLSYGRLQSPPRPWMGLYATEIAGNVVVVGIASKGPAARAELETGDIILTVNGRKVVSLPEFFRGVWALGTAPIDVPLQIFRDGQVYEITLHATDRQKYLKSPVAH